MSDCRQKNENGFGHTQEGLAEPSQVELGTNVNKLDTLTLNKQNLTLNMSHTHDVIHMTSFSRRHTASRKKENRPLNSFDLKKYLRIRHTF